MKPTRGNKLSVAQTHESFVRLLVAYFHIESSVIVCVQTFTSVLISTTSRGKYLSAQLLNAELKHTEMMVKAVF